MEYDDNFQITSSRMKSKFLTLCFLLCAISVALYSNTTVDWKILHSILNKRFVIISYGSANFTFNYFDNTSQTASTQISPSSSGRQYAIFASSIHSTVQVYSFYMPIVAASWKRVGYETIAMFVGDFTDPNALSSRFNLTRAYIKHIGAHIVDIQCNSSYATKISQLARIFGGFLSDSIVRDDDYILTGDSDLMPMMASEYKPTTGTDGFIFNAFCCGKFKRRGRSYRMFPSKCAFIEE